MGIKNTLDKQQTFIKLLSFAFMDTFYCMCGLLTPTYYLYDHVEYTELISLVVYKDYDMDNNIG